MSKKFIVMLAVLIIAIALTACGGGGDKDLEGTGSSIGSTLQQVAEFACTDGGTTANTCDGASYSGPDVDGILGGLEQAVDVIESVSP